MPIHDALNRLIIDFDEADQDEGEVRAHGVMRFGAALEGPPGRLHGGHHAFVRTLPIVERVTAHEHARTFPCSVDVTMQQGLRLEEAIPFEATYRSDGESWNLTTRFEGTDRLVAHASSIPDEPLMSATELERWRALYADTSPDDDTFEMFGFTIHLSKDVVWLESRDPLNTLPGSQHPHFTKHIEIQFATGHIPAGTHLLCLADRTRVEEDSASETPPVEIKGQIFGTAHVPVALVDTTFERVFATGRVTVHPVDPAKFEALQKMRQIRKDR